jgi:hypothetical protein
MTILKFKKINTERVIKLKKNTFDILLLLARPGAGKSEIIKHLKSIDVSERTKRFHIGAFDEIDDFPMLWTWFEEDTILARLGAPRLHTDENFYFKSHHLWDLLIERICLEYEKKIREIPDYHRQKSTIIEFARGTEHGGFARSFKHLHKGMINKIAVLYINVSWEESLRKNRTRFNPDRPDTILEHSLPDEKLNKLYRHVDWDDITGDDPEFINIQGFRVPYLVFENDDDITTKRGKALSERLDTTLNQLWDLYQENSKV